MYKMVKNRNGLSSIWLIWIFRLLDEEFQFKDDEVDQLLYQLLMGHLPTTNRPLVAQLLIDNGARLDYRYKDNNT